MEPHQKQKPEPAISRLLRFRMSSRAGDCLSADYFVVGFVVVEVAVVVGFVVVSAVVLLAGVVDFAAAFVSVPLALAALSSTFFFRR